MYIDVQNLALLVVLPRANQFSQYAQFALFTKVFLAHTLIDKNTTSRGEPQVLFSLNPQFLMFLFFQYLIN